MVRASDNMRTNYIEICACLPHEHAGNILETVCKKKVRFYVDPPLFVKEGFRQYKKLPQEQKDNLWEQMVAGIEFTGRDQTIDYITGKIKEWYDKVVEESIKQNTASGSMVVSDDEEAGPAPAPAAQPPPRRRRMSLRQAEQRIHDLEEELAEVKQENLQLRKCFLFESELIF
jgi:hypothetical protein